MVVIELLSLLITSIKAQVHTTYPIGDLLRLTVPAELVTYVDDSTLRSVAILRNFRPHRRRQLDTPGVRGTSISTIWIAQRRK